MAKKKGITPSGFKYKIDLDKLNSWDILEDIESIDENPTKIVKLSKKILGEAQYNKLKEHCRENNRIPIERMNEEIEYILSNHDETKN